MPYGPGTYGNQAGRPPQQQAGGVGQNTVGPNFSGPPAAPPQQQQMGPPESRRGSVNTSYLATLPPEMLEQMINLGQISEEQARIALEMKDAQELTQGRSRGQHDARTGVTVSGGALGLGADLFDRYRGHKEVKSLEEEREELLGRQKEGRKAYLDAYKGLFD